jgi:hypothetical protein
MIIFCYHNGALGRTTSALIECCTKDGEGLFPIFDKTKNLHHYRPTQKLFEIRHPYCDVETEKKLGNFVISASSSSIVGRYLILLMGLKKWNNDEPNFDHEAVYKQHGNSYGEQLEILSLTMKDKVESDSDWYIDADQTLDILDYWHSAINVSAWLRRCGFIPLEDQVSRFCYEVAQSNQIYYDKINVCVDIVNDVISQQIKPINLSFFEIAVCHGMLLQHYSKPHNEVKLLTCHPSSTQDLVEAFCE